MAAVIFVSGSPPAPGAVDGLRSSTSGPFPDYREVVDGTGRASGRLDHATTGLVRPDRHRHRRGRGRSPSPSSSWPWPTDSPISILPSGTYFSLDRRELRELARLIAEARALHDAAGDGIRLSRFQASLWEDLQRLGVVTAQARRVGATRSALLAEAADRHRLPRARRPRTPPSGPISWPGSTGWPSSTSTGLGGILADDMGLGKTLQALALICHARERG